MAMMAVPKATTPYSQTMASGASAQSEWTLPNRIPIFYPVRKMNDGVILLVRLVGGVHADSIVSEKKNASIKQEWFVFISIKFGQLLFHLKCVCMNIYIYVCVFIYLADFFLFFAWCKSSTALVLDDPGKSSWAINKIKDESTEMTLQTQDTLTFILHQSVHEIRNMTTGQKLHRDASRQNRLL